MNACVPWVIGERISQMEDAVTKLSVRPGYRFKGVFISEMSPTEVEWQNTSSSFCLAYSLDELHYVLGLHLPGLRSNIKLHTL